MYSRNSFYLIMLACNCRSFLTFFTQLLSDRAKQLLPNGSSDGRQLTVRYCKQEFSWMVGFFAVLSAQSAMFTVNGIYVSPNDFRLPNKFIIPWLPFEVYSLVWVINYAFDLATYIESVVCWAFYLSMVLIFISHSCWMVDSALLCANQLQIAMDSHDSVTSKETCMKVLVERCCDILNWQRGVNSFLKYSFFVEFAIMSTMICAMVFSAINYGVKIFFVLSSLVVTQLFVTCALGSKLNSRFGKLSAVLYELNWLEMTSKQRRDLQMTLLMSQNMKGFNAIFVPVNLKTFQSVRLFFNCLSHLHSFLVPDHEFHILVLCNS